jgi:hypothetical protein
MNDDCLALDHLNACSGLFFQPLRVRTASVAGTRLLFI